ncbi:MAG TPA: redoxin domain-containing protein [Streptosporangiaceae bacterium]
MRNFYYAVSLLGLAPRRSARRRSRRRAPGRPLIAALAAVMGAAAIAGCGAAAPSGISGAGSTATQQAAANPDLDPGTSMHGNPAPDFSLTNQFGQRMSLSDFRGKVVILAFTDSQCTTVCPLTTESMLAAKQLLGQAGSHVQLLGVDANPAATKVSDVLSYSRAHGMVNQWDFLTGSDAQLAKVWKAYDIYTQIVKGQVDHTPALYIIDTRGREQKLYLTTMAYASIGQAAQVMAQETASVLPGHPKLASMRSLAYVSGLSPRTSARLATLPSGSLTLGPGESHLVVFFATWLNETSDLRARLLGLDQYVRSEHDQGLPPLVAVDEEAAESSAATVRSYVASVGKPLGYPIALDPTGRLADGYGVQDQPWFVLTSAAGKILWKHDGWLSVNQLIASVRTASG